MENQTIPNDGPEAALARIVRKLRLPYSRTFVAGNVARHSKPNSLLALVEVGEQVGVKTRPAQIEDSAFDQLDLPLLVHFKGADSGGFGVLERVTPEAFHVWDSSAGLRPMPRELFFDHWSGVVALVERGESRTLKEKGYVKQRVLDWVFSGWDAPEVVAGGKALAIRIALGLVVLALWVLGLWNVPSSERVPVALLGVLSLVGLAVTVVTAVSIGSESGLSDRVCKKGKYVDCHGVLSSRYSRIFGIPFADIGIAFFASTFLLSATGAALEFYANLWVVAVAFAVSIPISLALIGAQIGMRQLCTLCLAVHVTNFCAAAVSWLWLQPAASSLRDGVVAFLWFGFLFALVLFFVVPLFKKHQGMVVLAGMHRRISSSPFASLAELLTERPTGVAAGACGLAVNAAGSDSSRSSVLGPPVVQQVRPRVAGGFCPDPVEPGQHLYGPGATRRGGCGPSYLRRDPRGRHLGRTGTTLRDLSGGQEEPRRALGGRSSCRNVQADAGGR